MNWEDVLVLGAVGVIGYLIWKSMQPISTVSTATVVPSTLPITFGPSTVLVPSSTCPPGWGRLQPGEPCIQSQNGILVTGIIGQ